MEVNIQKNVKARVNIYKSRLFIIVTYVGLILLSGALLAGICHVFMVRLFNIDPAASLSISNHFSGLFFVPATLFMFRDICIKVLPRIKRGEL